MAYEPHFRVAMLGTMGIAPELESWTFGLKYDGVDATDYSQATADGVADAIFSALSTMIVSSLMKFSDLCYARSARVYRVGTDGLTYGVIGYAGGSDAVSGARTTDLHPYQISNVISLVAPGRPPGVRGRCYLPPQGVSVNTSSQIDETDTTNFINGFATMATAVGTALEGLTAATPELVIASGVGSGTLKKVEELRCGRIPDTHRSRRRSLDEAYTALPYP